MISLLWIGIFVNVLRIFIPTIETWVTKAVKVSNGELITKLRQDLREIRKEQRDISIVDNFAKHARLTRKITALQTQLDEEVKLNTVLLKSIRSKITLGVNGLLLFLCAIIYFKSSGPVIQLPIQWMLPLSYFSSSWSVGFTFWISITYMSIKQIHGAVKEFMGMSS